MEATLPPHQDSAFHLPTPPSSLRMRVYPLKGASGLLSATSVFREAASAAEAARTAFRHRRGERSAPNPQPTGARASLATTVTWSVPAAREREKMPVSFSSHGKRSGEEGAGGTVTGGHLLSCPATIPGAPWPSLASDSGMFCPPGQPGQARLPCPQPRRPPSPPALLPPSSTSPEAPPAVLQDFLQPSSPSAGTPSHEGPRHTVGFWRIVLCLLRIVLDFRPKPLVIPPLLLSMSRV